LGFQKVASTGVSINSCYVLFLLAAYRSKVSSYTYTTLFATAIDLMIVVEELFKWDFQEVACPVVASMAANLFLFWPTYM
jgi:hypothetical protein